VVYPEPIVDAFESFGAPGNDALRYYLLREAPFGHDTSFSYEALIQRYNSDLANDLGNLASRTVHLIVRLYGGAVPAGPDAVMRVERKLEAIPGPTKELRQAAETARDEYCRHFHAYDLSRALDALWRLLSEANKYLNKCQPWKRDEDAETVLYATAAALRFGAVMAYPILPHGAHRVWLQLGCEEDLGKIEDQRVDQLRWEDLKPGTKVGKPEPIFPRLDKAKALAKLEEYAEADRQRSQPKGATIVVPSEKQSAVASQPPSASQADSSSPAAPQNDSRPPAATGQSAIDNRQSTIPSPAKISIDDFAKVEMVVGQIISAEPIPKAQRLLKLQVDIGTEIRQVCAGIAEFYKPEEVTGMKIVLVANLEPRKLRGVESNGMVVAASIGPEGRPVLATFKEDVPNGTRLK